MMVKEIISMPSGGKQTIMTPFPDYCGHLQTDVFRALGDVESLCEMITGQQRCDWVETEVAAFEKVRKRLLDVAGALNRLPTS